MKIILDKKTINVLREQTKEVNRLEDLYQSTYDKYDKKIDKLKDKRDLALETIWNSFIEEEAKLKKMIGSK